MARTEKPGKLLPLEGLRGIAAIVVMLGHIARGLVPPAAGPLNILNEVHAGLLNGGAAVSVFFVLSGLILALPFARDRSPARVLTAFLKRWPRLVALTTIACLFSWATMLLSQDDYERAGRMTGNYWMASHFNAPLHGQDMSWTAALSEGLYRMYLFGEVRFDSPLWTMRIELFGSFAVFLCAPLLFRLTSWPLRLAAIAVAMLALGTTPPATYFTDFLVGMILAMLLAEQKLPVLSNIQAAAIALIGLYLFCFSAAEARLIYAPLKAVLPAADTAHFVWDLAAALIIMVLLGNPFARRVFSQHWAIWLGKLSFPVYLLHVPIMLSAGAASHVRSAAALGTTTAVSIAALVTIVLTLACALPLVWVDRAWTDRLGRLAGVLLARFRSG